MMVSLALNLLLLLCLLVSPVLYGKEEDLYAILGVKRTATTKEIKSAYRRKALDTHPDKNKDVPPEEAAEAFHKVVHAFEVLSDESSRRSYDRRGSSSSSSHSGSNSNSNWSFQWTWSSSSGSSSTGGGSRTYQHSYRKYQKPKMKDKAEVKQAQSRVMHIIGMEQLRTIMLDDETDLLERNLLFCFVTPKVEKIADDNILYPFPFAGMSSQGIWWEDLLQTVKVRFHHENEITKYFNITHGKDITSPIFLFGRRGLSLDEDKRDVDKFTTIKSTSRERFEKWMWEQISVQMLFINRHLHPVEIYWIHGTRAHKKLELKPNEQAYHTSMLSHEWWVRDARVDTRHDSPGRYKLSENTCLKNWKILDDKEDIYELIIEPKACYDLSGHCGFWDGHNECVKNPSFMREQCLKTCGWCNDEDDRRLQEEIRQEQLQQQEEQKRIREQEEHQQQQQQHQHQQQQEHVQNHGSHENHRGDEL